MIYSINPAVDLCCAMLQYAYWDEIVSTIITGYKTGKEFEARYQLEDCSSIPLEQIYKLLSDDSRRLILQLLCRKP